VTLRLAVTPPQQSAYVAGIANSARFKYVLGKQAGIKPALAQKLEAKAPANSSIVEARLGVLTKEEGQRCLEAFARTLQVLCGTQARITVIERSLIKTPPGRYHMAQQPSGPNAANRGGAYLLDVTPNHRTVEVPNVPAHGAEVGRGAPLALVLLKSPSVWKAPPGRGAQRSGRSRVSSRSCP
jgi:hypothetical protein